MMTTQDPHALTAGELGQVVYEGAVDPVLVLSRTGVVLEANEPARTAFGDEVIGRHFGIPTAEGGAVEVELLADGGPRVAELRIGSAVLDGEDVWVATLRDVTERKRVEQSLRDFVSTASHEFRTPLFAIQGFAETLEAQWGELDDEDRQRYVAIIHRQARRLTRLTDDLLTVARLDGEAMESSPATVLPGVIVDRVQQVLDLEITTDIARGLRVWVDPDHLEDVLVNLLTNAEKYGAPPFEVRGTREQDQAVLRVVDHGGGIPSEFRARMFERFARERRAAREQPGTGLGLAIVDGLVRRNGGTLDYEVTPGGGATFVLRLPASAG